MVASSTSSTSGTGLDATWTALINNQLVAEKSVRLNRLTKQNNDLDVKKAVFTDLSSQLSDLKSSLAKLWSSNASYVGNSAKSTSVTNPSVSGTTVLSGSADSTAAMGAYTIKVDKLANQHRLTSTSQSSSTTALGSAYSGTFTITLGGKSTDIDVDGTSDTLYTIASKINSATYDTGKGVTASVVDNKLIFQSNSTGSDYQMKLTDKSGTALKSLGILDGSGNIANELQKGENASFWVNGVNVNRSSNSSLTDVISGVTLNLEVDAEGKTATFNVQSDTSAIKTGIQTFISKYNALQTYLKNKTTSTKVDDTHYTAGALANEFSVRSLKSDLADQISFSAGTGAVKFFGDMGLSLSNNQLSISDSSKLDAALKNNPSDVKSFLDTKMSKIDTLLGSYVGSDSSFVTYSLKSMTDQKTSLATNIANENKRLDARKAALTAYYQNIQAQLTADSNTTASLSSYIYSSIYGSTNKIG